MFSLLITIIAIALVALLAIAVIHYGGHALNRGSTKAAATTLLNEASQISAARALALAEARPIPEGTQVVLPTELLATMPTPPANAYVTGTPSAQDWQYYVSSPAHFGIQTKINKETCMEVNRMQGFIGIPVAWDAVTSVQCFGDSQQGYTYLYEPNNVTPAQHQEAVTHSVTDAQTTQPTAVPGYPRECPDGSVLSSGLCVAGDVVPNSPSDPTGPTGPSTPKHYSVFSIGNATTDGYALAQYVQGYLTLCSSDAPFSAMNSQTTFTIGGVPVHQDWGSGEEPDPNSGPSCITIEDLPALPAGPAVIQGVNPDGSTLTGTILYVDQANPEPEMTSLTPASGPADKEALVTINGKNFRPGVILYVMGYPLDPSTITYVDGSHIRFVMPPMAKFPNLAGAPLPQNIQVMAYNADSYQGSGYTYYMYTNITDKPNAATISPNQAYVDGSLTGNGVRTTANICPTDATSQVFARGVFVTFGDNAEVYERTTVANGSGGYCVTVTVPTARAAGTVTVNARVTDTVNYTPDQVYTMPFTYKAMPATKALKISGFMVDDGTMTFTSVDSCDGVSKDDICLPAFNSPSSSWTWASNNVPMQWDNDNTSSLSPDGILLTTQTQKLYHGFTITDGTHAYTITDEVTQRSIRNYLPMPLSPSAAFYSAVTPTGNGGTSVSCSKMFDTLRAASQNWNLYNYDCDTMTADPVANTINYSYTLQEDWMTFDSWDLSMKNTAYKTNSDCETSGNCTFKAPGSLSATPFYIGDLRDSISVGSGTIVRPGTSAGPQGAWPAAPAK